MSEPARPLASIEDDASLARRVAAGPSGAAADAEEELYRRLAPRVRLYGLRHLRDPAAAADLVQDVLLLTLDSLRAGRVREPERLASFALGACRKRVAELRRGAARRQRLLDRHAGDVPVARLPDPPSLDGVRLHDCLERLPQRDQVVLVLSFYAEKTADEVAAELDMSPGNVRVTRYRALGRLRDCMAGKATS